jgi:DNA-binding transcriptional ArsR family regulator
MGPNVRDFTDRDRHLPVSVESSLLFEVLIAFWVVSSDSEDFEHEVAPELIAAIDAQAPSLRAEIRSLTDCELGLTLVGVGWHLEGERSVPALIEWLQQAGPVALRTLLMAGCGVNVSKGHDGELIAAAADGDPAAVDAILSINQRVAGLEPLLRRKPDAMLEEIIDLVQRFAAAAEPILAPRQHLLDRAAADGRTMATTVRPEELVERLTNGVTFVLQPEIGEVVLIPSIVIRPWVVITEHHSTRLFVYSVSDELLSDDHDAPPAFLVDTFKALGDENRLRLLGVLAEGDKSLKQIADRVDLGKSTVHHHLRLLRSAGLVRVIVSDDDKRYSLRPDAIEGSGLLLRDYLAGRRLRDHDKPEKAPEK